MNSFNHYSLGSVGQWLYEHVAGIRAGARRATSTSLIAPEPGGLEWARADLPLRARPDHQRVAARTRDASTLEVEIPPNVTATVIVPGGEPVEVGSGRHSFSGVLAPV